jgi:hypothetical protein
MAALARFDIFTDNDPRPVHPPTRRPHPDCSGAVCAPWPRIIWGSQLVHFIPVRCQQAIAFPIMLR